MSMDRSEDAALDSSFTSVLHELGGRVLPLYKSNSAPEAQ